MNKPPINTVLKIMDLKEQAKDLLKQGNTRVAELAEEFEAGRYDYDLEGEEGFEDKRYLKFEITDNAAALTAGQTVWKSTSFSPMSVSFSKLKGIPKSLKEEASREG